MRPPKSGTTASTTTTNNNANTANTTSTPRKTGSTARGGSATQYQYASHKTQSQPPQVYPSNQTHQHPLSRARHQPTSANAVTQQAPREELPRDARTMQMLLHACGVTDADDAVIPMLLEFAHRYVAETISSAAVYAEHAGRSAASIEPVDLRAATVARGPMTATTAPPMDIMAEIAHKRNRLPLPPITQRSNIRLPPFPYTLTSPNFVVSSARPSDDDPRLKISLARKENELQTKERRDLAMRMNSVPFSLRVPTRQQNVKTAAADSTIVEKDGSGKEVVDLVEPPAVVNSLTVENENETLAQDVVVVKATEIEIETESSTIPPEQQPQSLISQRVEVEPETDFASASILVALAAGETVAASEKDQESLSEAVLQPSTSDALENCPVEENEFRDNAVDDKI